MAAAQTTDAARRVPTRRISFEDRLQDLPKHFAADGNVFASHLLANLSSVFPDGEEYFIRSVRHYRDRITDPDLRRQVAGFIGQETVHGREHRAFNERLHELGYPTRRIDRVNARISAWVERFLSPERSLAETVALEHLTAVLAETILGDARARADLGHPVVHDLFVWHALEESEHKAVAFDVYRAMGLSEQKRIKVMRAIRRQFIAAFTVLLWWTVLTDRDARRSGDLRGQWRRFRRMPIVGPGVRARLRDAERVGFHPDDVDATDLVAEWNERLFGPEGTIVGQLRTGAA